MCGHLLLLGYLNPRFEAYLPVERHHELLLPSTLITEPSWACRRDGDNLLSHRMGSVVTRLRFRQERRFVHYIDCRVKEPYLVLPLGDRQNSTACCPLYLCLTRIGLQRVPHLHPSRLILVQDPAIPDQVFRLLL